MRDTGPHLKVIRGGRPSLSVRDLTIGIQTRVGHRQPPFTRVIAEHISFDLEPGESLVILGPNGAGKTTLLRTILGLMPALSGQVAIGGTDVLRCNPRRRAQLIAYVPQSQQRAFGFRVRDLVTMGRAPFLSTFSLPSRADRQLADAALEQLEILHLADTLTTELSGGEQRLVLIARALAQQSPYLLLDEPTANLDYANQAIVLRSLATLSHSGLGIIMNSHSPSHAFACANQAALLSREGHFTVGPVSELVSGEQLSAVYGIPVHTVSVTTRWGQIQTCVPEYVAPRAVNHT